jgi:hypothetical protein
MNDVRPMLQTHPAPSRLDTDALVECIEACFGCAQSCTACADACLAEDMVAELRQCIRLNLDCADICGTTGRLLSRQTQTNRDLLMVQVEACLQACRRCGDECQKHAEMHEHCRVCMKACKRCEAACNALIGAMA